MKKETKKFDICLEESPYMTNEYVYQTLMDCNLSPDNLMNLIGLIDNLQNIAYNKGVRDFMTRLVQKDGNIQKTAETFYKNPIQVDEIVEKYNYYIKEYNKYTTQYLNTETQYIQ